MIQQIYLFCGKKYCYFDKIIGTKDQINYYIISVFWQHKFFIKTVELLIYTNYAYYYVEKIFFYKLHLENKIFAKQLQYCFNKKDFKRIFLCKTNVVLTWKTTLDPKPIYRKLILFSPWKKVELTKRTLLRFAFSSLTDFFVSTPLPPIAVPSFFYE